MRRLVGNFIFPWDVGSLGARVAGELYQSLGEAIRRRRDDAGLTQAALGLRVGLGRTSITNIESGSQAVLLHQFMELADALHASPADLLDDVRTSFCRAVSSEHAGGAIDELMGRLEKRGGAR